MNTASLLILVFLAITFIQSGYEKVTDWQTNVDWLKGHFSGTFLEKNIPAALFALLALEIIAGVLCVVGCIQLLVNNGRSFGFYGAVVSCLALLLMLFGQRLAKDYDGARTIVLYFIPAVMAVYWLG